MPKKKYRVGQKFLTEDKGSFVVLQHSPEKILLDSGKFKYRTKLLIRSDATGYVHWIMQTGLSRSKLTQIDEDTFKVGNSRSFHVSDQSRNLIKYKVGNIITNKEGVYFEILDRQYKNTGFGNRHAWVLLRSLSTGYTRWRNTDKLYKNGGPRDIENKISAITIKNLHDPDASQLPKEHVRLWHSMMKRCYEGKNPKEKQKTNEPRVSKDWLNLYTFSQQIVLLAGYEEWIKDTSGHHLDKDIMKEGNKEYSLRNCQFVPARVNIMFTANKNGCTVECTKTGVRYPSMADCSRVTGVSYGTVQKHVNGKVKRPKWVRV